MMMSPIWAIWTFVLLLLPFTQGIPTSGSRVIHAKYNNKYKPDPYALINTKRKWQARLGKGKSISSIKGEIGNATATSVLNDAEYVTSVAFGTPPQWLSMVLDTGSSDVWVYSSLMDPNSLLLHNYYKPDDSSTATHISNSTWVVQYGDGTAAKGTVYKDTVNIAGIDIKKAAVEAASSVSGNLLMDTNINGIFGLAYNMSSHSMPEQPTVLSRLSKQLDSNVFTVDLKYRSNGEYEFGRIDTTKVKAGHKIHYAPLSRLAETSELSPGPSAEYWSTKFTKITFDVSIDDESGGDDDHSTTTTYGPRSTKAAAQVNHCIVDTGTTLLLLPDKTVSTYYQNVNGSHLDIMQGYVFPCGTHLPDLSITFSSASPNSSSSSYASQEFTLTIPGKYIEYTQIGGDNVCLGGLQTDTGIGFSIIGDIFLKAVFAVFDIENARVGFAPKDL